MQKKLIVVALLIAWPLGARTAPLERAALSHEAQALVPEEKTVTVQFKDGREQEGIIVEESDTHVELRIQATETIASARRFARDTIEKILVPDVVPGFAAVLLEMEPDPDASRSLEEYDRILPLFNEFLEKCAGAEAYETVQERRDIFLDKRRHVERGMERVDGEWLPPIAASIRHFEMHTREIEALRERDDAQTNERVLERMETLIGKRRDTARNVPRLMQDRLPELLEANRIDEAVYETTAFLTFWIDQVIETEGEERDALAAMDFDFILRMQDRIMDAYRAAGLGRQPRPGKAPADKDMIYIPGGYFLMGEKGGDPGKDTFPQRMVYVSPFLIGKYQVTNEEYRKFVEHVQTTGESWFQHPKAPPLKQHEARGWEHDHLSGPRQPVVGVDWFDAFGYARWSLGQENFKRGRMRRLPTEAEWEKAARGLDGRTYPWGEETAPAQATVNWPNFRTFIAREMDRQNPPRHPDPPPSGFGCGGCVEREDRPPPPSTRIPDQTWPVDQWLPQRALDAREDELFEWDQEHASPYGVYHMAGNAAEWVQDYYDPHAYRHAPIKDPLGPMEPPQDTPNNARVYRGGSYLSETEEELTTFWRGHPQTEAERVGCMPQRRGRGIGAPFIGFRLAQSLDLVQPDAQEEKADPPALSFDELMRSLQED